MGARSPKEHRWILDYHMPGGGPLEPRGISRDDDEEDELEQDDQVEPPRDPRAVIEQVEKLFGQEGDEGFGRGGEVVLCQGDDIQSVELVAQGETLNTLAGGVDVSVSADGVCSASVALEDATMHLAQNKHNFSQLASPKEGVEVPPHGRLMVHYRDYVLVIRSVPLKKPPKPRAKLWRVLLVSLASTAILAFLVSRFVCH